MAKIIKVTKQELYEIFFKGFNAGATMFVEDGCAWDISDEVFKSVINEDFEPAYKLLLEKDDKQKRNKK